MVLQMILTFRDLKVCFLLSFPDKLGAYSQASLLPQPESGSLSHTLAG